MSAPQRRVIFVVGPTASGKSAWAQSWAEQFSGVVVNCDSIQVYKDVDIGSAMPSRDERSRCPHFLFDYVAPPAEMTAGIYARDFQQCLDQIPLSAPIFVVGGTGFYFQAIEKGMYPVTPISEDVRRAVAEDLQDVARISSLWQELELKDPDYSKTLHRADLYRLGRALEVIRATGRSMTELQQTFKNQQAPFPHRLHKVGPQWSKEDLNTRIQKRTRGMLAAGLVDEVKSLLDKGHADWAPLGSVGLKEVKDYLQHGGSLSQVEEDISIHTRQLAKKQRTWFQRDSEIKWHPGADEGFQAATLEVEKFLAP